MLYELSNNLLSVKISTLGAELQSLTGKDVEYLYGGDTAFWHRSSPLLFPIVGKLKHNNYTFQGKRYTLPIHGFARFKEFRLIKQTDSLLVFCLNEDEHTLKHFPFPFSLQVSYAIYEDMLEIIYHITSSKTIYFGFGTHPAFLLHANIDESYFSFNKSENQQALELDLANGCIKGSKGVELKGKKLQLHKNIFAKDALIYEHLNSDEICLKNSLNSKGIWVKFDGFDFLGLWAKVGAPYVCIEPWCSTADFTDTNHNLEEKKHIIKLNPKEEFRRKLQIKCF